MISLETLALAKKYTREYVEEHGGGGGGGKEYVKYGTTAGWNAQRTLVAERGIIYVYSDHSYIEVDGGDPIPVPGFKVGDGTSYLIDMPFATDAEIEMIGLDVDELRARLISHEENSIVHVTSADKENWNSKVSVRIDPLDAENLVLF